MSKVREVLEELVNNCNYRQNVSPNNYLLYKKESLDQAEAAIREAIKEENENNNRKI